MKLFPEIKDGYSGFKVTYNILSSEQDIDVTYFVIARHAPEALVALFQELGIFNNISNTVFEHLESFGIACFFSETKITAKHFWSFREDIDYNDLIIEKCDILDIKLNISMRNIIGKAEGEIRSYLLSALNDLNMLIQPLKKKTLIHKSKVFLADILSSQF